MPESTTSARGAHRQLDQRRPYDRDRAEPVAAHRDQSTFCDSFGNVHRSRLQIEGDVLTWTGDRTRCTVTMTDGGLTQVARHESSADGLTWAASMDVTLRKVISA
jgi:hypothetical protein